MEFKEINDILNKYQFFAITAKKPNDYERIYTYTSIAYYAITIMVYTIKTKPNTIGGDKLITHLTVNSQQVNDEKQLYHTLNNIYTLQKKERQKLYKTIK